MRLKKEASALEARSEAWKKFSTEVDLNVEKLYLRSYPDFEQLRKVKMVLAIQYYKAAQLKELFELLNAKVFRIPWEEFDRSSGWKHLSSTLTLASQNYRAIVATMKHAVAKKIQILHQIRDVGEDIFSSGETEVPSDMEQIVHDLKRSLTDANDGSNKRQKTK